MKSIRYENIRKVEIIGVERLNSKNYIVYLVSSLKGLMKVSL